MWGTHRADQAPCHTGMGTGWGAVSITNGSATCPSSLECQLIDVTEWTMKSVLINPPIYKGFSFNERGPLQLSTAT